MEEHLGSMTGVGTGNSATVLGRVSTDLGGVCKHSIDLGVYV